MSGLKLMGALSPLKLLQSTNNVLQPLQQTQNSDTNKNRNQNLLKAVNVTSARADSTGTENFNNFISVSSGITKGGKKTKGRAIKQLKNSVPSPTAEENETEETEWDTDDGGGHIKVVKHHHSVKKCQTPSVSRRNARERNRVKQVNSGFGILKEHVPHLKNKTSKVDTLRAAVDYIKNLRELLGEPLDENNLYQGPILITELDDHPSNNKSKNNHDGTKSNEGVSSTTPNSLSLFDFDPTATDTSFNASEVSSISPPIRSDSAQSNPDVANMVYQLPPMPMGHSNGLGDGAVPQHHFQYAGMDIQPPGSPTLSHISSGSGSSLLSSEIDSTKSNFDIIPNHSNENVGMVSGPAQTIYNLPNIHTLRNVDWTTTWQPQV